jgi:hypothetical protein
MDQISIKTPNSKCRLFLKIDQSRYLAAGFYLPEATDPLPQLLSRRHTVLFGSSAYPSPSFPVSELATHRKTVKERQDADRRMGEGVEKKPKSYDGEKVWSSIY